MTRALPSAVALFATCGDMEKGKEEKGRLPSALSRRWPLARTSTNERRRKGKEKGGGKASAVPLRIWLRFSNFNGERGGGEKKGKGHGCCYRAGTPTLLLEKKEKRGERPQVLLSADRPLAPSDRLLSGQPQGCGDEGKGGGKKKGMVSLPSLWRLARGGKKKKGKGERGKNDFGHDGSRVRKEGRGAFVMCVPALAEGRGGGEFCMAERKGKALLSLPFFFSAPLAKRRGGKERGYC